MSNLTLAQANAALAAMAVELAAANAAKESALADKAAAERKAEESRKARAVFTMKICKGGGILLKGLRGANIIMGCHLYATTLQDIFTHREEIEKYIADNTDKLSWARPAKAAK